MTTTFRLQVDHIMDSCHIEVQQVNPKTGESWPNTYIHKITEKGLSHEFVIHDQASLEIYEVKNDSSIPPFLTP